MAISYPISLPAIAVPRVMGWNPTSTNAVVESPFTKEIQTQLHNGDLLSFGLGYDPLSLAESRPMIAALLSLRGVLGTFNIPIYGYEDILGVGTGTPVVNGTGQTRTRELSTRGWTINTTGILLRGDIIGIGSGANSRVYSVLQDVNSDGSGNATIDIFPQLRGNPVDGATITLDSPELTVKQTTNNPSWTVDILTVGFAIDVREAI